MSINSPSMPGASVWSLTCCRQDSPPGQLRGRYSRLDPTSGQNRPPIYKDRHSPLLCQ
jgi:hypothetical protein